MSNKYFALAAGEGSGPPLDLARQSAPLRDVSSSPPLLPSDQNGDLLSSSTDTSSSEDQPAVHFVERPHFHITRALPVGGDVKPLSRATRREGVVIALGQDETVGTGQAYRRHIPLTTHLHVNDTSGPPLSSLLDTGASLSVIDAGLLSSLGGQPTGSPMRILGLGDKTSLGWATITFFLPAHDSHHRPVFLECTLDFHVIQDFAPQLCLGLDFITTQGVTIDASNDRATLGRYAFRVFEKMPAPFAKEAELCATTSCLVPAKSMAWVPVDVACLAPGVDYRSLCRRPGLHPVDGPSHRRGRLTQARPTQARPVPRSPCLVRPPGGTGPSFRYGLRS
ncbi:hypothetical protein A4X13_0g8363 [Tilletia indica]|uniref:Peptidase A2 domain-containing protein n=1 Tax=Tilletia indica TaxID=43049 RepID=A0A8T8SG44_9BASI|nr:hypothetical protein A4X13_0g8363 [Tilletia indica]